ncbi:MAG: ATP-grasp domain-containing protein [Isosphaeraceae bacterium]|nr:ATP-grasp domain-containing protein [Isosphaeraceae bacterium]
MNAVAIVAASGRMLAASALRAGFSPWIIDAFADADTRALGPTVRVDLDDFGSQALDRLRELPDMPWIYGGGVENDPDFVEIASAERPLLGISAPTLRAVRDFDRVRQALEGESIALPERLENRPSTGDARLLVKPRRSAGGVGIRELAQGDPWPEGDVVVERFVEGKPIGGLYLASDRGVELLGITRPTAWLERSISPFLYRGTVGPIATLPEVSAAVERAGRVIAGRFGLRGLFGIDFIVDDSGRTTLLEVNPRPTASLEVIELALGRSLLAEHAAIFGVHSGATPRPASRAWGRVEKVVIYAESELLVPADWSPPSPADDPWSPCELVDVPTPGTRIPSGSPVFTMLVAGPRVKRCDLGRIWKRRRGLIAEWSENARRQRSEPRRPSLEE